MKTEYDDIRLAIACDKLRTAINSRDTTVNGYMMVRKVKTLYTLTASGSAVLENMRKVERY